jgi:hypothetical protein
MRQTFAAIAAVAILAAAPAIAQQATQAAAQETGSGGAEASWLPSLLTETPEEGFDLAVSMARKAVTTTQTDIETLRKLRPAYAHDPNSLIDVSGVVASYFATIAEANDYWRE